MFDVTFWGVRGSVAVSGVKINRYGCNTSCVSVKLDNRTIIFDAGTGICKFGNCFEEVNGNTALDADIFLSHYHADHIEGLPFFSPLFNQKSNISIYGTSREDMDVGQVIDNYIKYPYYPITLADMGADINFISVKEYDCIELNEKIKIRTIPINHPGGCNAYRLEYCGSSLVYMTDIEIAKCNYKEICSFVNETDLLIFDVFFDDDYINGWGHSTSLEAVELANDANIKNLALFHPSFTTTDYKLAAREAKTKQFFKNSFVPIEGQIISIY